MAELTERLETLTPRQRQVYDQFRSHYRETGVPPSLRELMAPFGISNTNGIMSHVRSLIKKGLLRNRGAKSHAIMPVVPVGVCPCCGHKLEDQS